MADVILENGGEEKEMASSVLLSCLASSFRNILEQDFDEELLKETKERESRLKSKKKKKDKDKDKKDAPPPKKHEKKTVLREGNNSLVTYPNPSSFSVFTRIRHFVLQQELCVMYNLRNKDQESEESEDESEGDEEEKNKKKTLPEVVNLGICGVFSILQEVWETNPQLCQRVLNEFLNILQGQSPGGLMNEPTETTTALFQLLMRIVSSSSNDSISEQLSSIASSCLLSLVLALGHTSKILGAVAALLIAPPTLSENQLKVPEILRSLQVSVQAVLVGSPYNTDWYDQGVPAKSLVDNWSLAPSIVEAIDRNSPAAGIASDSRHLYLHGPFGLMKLGSGYGNTIKGHVYSTVSDFYNNKAGRLLYLSGKLYFNPSDEQNSLIVIDPVTLKIEDTMEFESEGLKSHCLFSDGTDLKQITSKKEGGFVLRKLTTLCSPIPVVEEKQLDLSQKSILCLGRTKYDQLAALHTFYQDNSSEVQHLTGARNVAIVYTSSGKLLYQGSGVALGITGKDVPKGQWTEVDLPDPKSKVVQVSCDNTGSFCLVVSDKGVVYFGGVNKKGEAGESAPGGRQQPKPIKFKKINKLKDSEIVSCACGPHTSAMIAKDGKLFIFGAIEEELVDKNTGVVTSMLGVPASQVALGRSHTVVLTQLGTVYTFGNNLYGQCGRNYVPPGEDQNLEAGGEEETESDDDDTNDGMCAQGEHVFVVERCLICPFCKFCSGYGPSCCNEGMPGRDAGGDCGCGSGDSGCSQCGACKVCAGVSDSWGGGMTFHELEDVDEPAYERVRKARSGGGGGSKKKDKKEEKDEMGLQLLFGGGGGGGEGEENEEEKKKDEKSPDTTKLPELLSLPEDKTVMQISCGAFHTALLFHTGEVYTFGNGNHGQLGQGNNKPCGHPVKVPLPGPAQQVSCGDNHTLVLLTTGEVYSFGKHQEGQLGRSQEEQDDSSWHMTPGPIQIVGDSYRPKWIHATGNQSFISVDESLVSESVLPKCHVFGHPECIGLLPPPISDAVTSHLIVIKPSSCVAKKLESEEQQSLVNNTLCVDPVYNVLWTYSPSSLQLSCYNPVAAEVKDSSGTILSPSLCLPQSKDSTITRFHGAMNVLSSLHTLSTNPPLSLHSLTGKKMKSFAVDDYHILPRFTTHGGGWGYNAGSIEAVRMSPDQDVLLGGFGLYGGRGQYNAEIKVMELGESSDPETEGTLLASVEEKGYSCERNKTYKLLFERPVVLLADHWYVVLVMIVSPSGASTDAGSSGISQATGPDSVVFKFKNSRKSNNGTDVSSGQIPEILYRIPEFEQESGVTIQLLEKEFSLTVAPEGLQAVQDILEWSWDSLAREPEHTDQLKVIVKSSLGILSSHIKEVYPAKGTNKKGPVDSVELAECVYKTLWLIKRIFSSRQSSMEQYQDIIGSCRDCFTSCFHAFYPSALLKWLALCTLLQQIDPSDAIAGFPGDNVLSAVLEALSSPDYSYIGLSYDNTYSFQTVLHNSSQEERFPILTEFMQHKTMEEYTTGAELLSFTAVSSKLLALVSGTLKAELTGQKLPPSVVVEKAGQFLISRSNELGLCSCYPEVTALSGLPLTSVKRKEKLSETCQRFTTHEAGHPELTVTDVLLSVNKPVLLNGCAVFGGAGDDTYNFTVSVLKDGETLITHDGTFNRSDYYGDRDLVNLIFPESLKLEPQVIYTLRVDLKGPSFTIGTEGEMNLSGPGGVIFSLHSTGLSESDPETGPVAKFLYSSSTSSPQNIVQLSVHIASVLLDLTVSFLERILHQGLSMQSVDILSSSFLLSKLLPTTIAHLGPIASLQPKSSIGVLDMIRRTLPIVSTVVQRLQEDTPPLDDTNIHYAIVETDHPYKPASVSHFKVSFPEKVSWLTLEFDPKCGFAQQEDKLASLLIPRNGRSKGEGSDGVAVATVTPMVGVAMDDLYADFQHFGLDTPAGLVLIPGNEVHIVVNTETEYEKRDKSNHYGIKCKVIGYEWSSDSKQCMSLLEKELVSLGAMCAGSLLSEDINLPYSDELPVSSDPNETEKADMRIVQAAAEQVLSGNSQLLGRGLYAKVSSVQTVLRGDVPLITNNAEQQFLQEFIKSNVDTPGGRLARWLQPDQSVDPDASELELVKSTEGEGGGEEDSSVLRVGKQVSLVVRTRDHDKQVVYVEGMNVEVKAEWQGDDSTSSLTANGSIRNGVDKVTGVRKPTYKRPFNPTMLGTNHIYQSISMMMPYTDYSFEELRFHAPKVIGSVESMAITSHHDGTYTVSWVPTCPGTYDIRVCIDGTASGQHQSFVVLPAVSDDKEEVEIKETTPTTNEEEEEETVITETIKKKKFTGVKAQGLRIRAKPSFAAAAIGLIRPGNILSYTEEVENDAGTWIKLSQSTLTELSCTKSEGYALSYSKAREDDFLEDEEPEVVKRVVKKRSGTSNKRIDGPGSYSIVQCGSAGHNVRSKPNMKGCPLGRLHKGNTVEVTEEIENDDGIWLKLSPESLKKYCPSCSDTDEGWTLVVHPSGRIYLTQEGDESYQSNDLQSTAQAFPTAASVFGTPQTSIFGSEAPPPPPPPPPPPSSQSSFKFGGVKLAFGSPEALEKKSEEGGVFKFSATPTSESKSEEDTSESNKEKVKRRVRLSAQESKEKGEEEDKKEKGEKEKEGEEKKEEEEEEEEVKEKEKESSQKEDTPKVRKRQALSPAVAECQRAIFAAFLWQSGLVHDSMASALYLKFHPDVTKEGGVVMPEGGASEDEKLPSTLHHLVTFWDEISQKVIESSAASFSPPKVPQFAQELLKRYEEEKKEMERVKKEKEKKSGAPAAAGGGVGGSTTCELCDVIFPDPVTYHMKDTHPGCGKHANGWGYNSRGSYCSGWAGNCGDGGRGGSTWYLLCKDCHAKYLSQKEENKRKVTKPVTVPKMKTRKPGKPRSLPVIPAVQVMIQNAKFLLEVTSSSDGGQKVKPPFVSSDLSRQSSTPVSEEAIKSQTLTKEAPLLSYQRPRGPPVLARSSSMATGEPHVKRTFSDSGEDSLAPPTISRQFTHIPESDTANTFSETSALMTRPSMALANLMYRRSCSTGENGYDKLMSFITSYHDLNGLKVTMKQMMRIANLRATALEFFEWLLLQVHSPSAVHDILWQFMCSVSDHPMLQAAAKVKAQKEEEDKDEKKTESKDWNLGKNPLTGLEGAGVALTRLRTVFHSLLQTIADRMSELPVGSIAQQMALRCWCLDFQPQDHSFLLQSKVFVTISEALSGLEESEGDKVVSKKKEPVVQLMVNILPEGKLKVSSNDGMVNSLTDGSTETYWESRDEPRGKPRSLTASFEKRRKIFGASVHIDNTKDNGQKVEQLSLLVGPDEDGLKEVDKCKLPSNHAGWKTLTVPASEQDCLLVRIELRGVQNNVRARQVQILGYPTASTSNGSMSTDVAMRKDCEAEALRLFRILTTQVFGALLKTSKNQTEEEEETDGDADPSTTTDEEHSSMANILYNKSKLSGLQKAVCKHIMESLHKEACRLRNEWEESLKDPKAPAPSRQISHDTSNEGTSPKGPDVYCYELLTMLGGLSKTELGCNYLAEQSQLIQDLMSLLHTASVRVQLQICTFLRHILPYIKPREFATMTNVTVLPPLGYSAIAEAVNSAATINQLGLLDCLLAVIGKALSVQVKVKGRGSNILQKLTGDNTITAVTLANLKNPKLVAGETHVRTLRWYLQGSIEQEVANEVVKLLKDMTKSVLKGHWKDYAKSAIGQAVLHLTKINEENRHADPGMYSHTLWLSLAALCVIDEEHAEALSSGQWLGQDGKPQTKPLCDNHDDGETKALILCDCCGNLCGECDRVLHYHKRNHHHQRQVFKEEEEAVKVDLHEGCGRIKLYWTMALADSRTLKGMVEFKDTIGGSGKGACRFCGTTSNTGLLAIGNVCADPECQERAQAVCTKTLSCGHLCCGVKDEKKCLPCLHGCGSKEGVSDPPLKQDADDMCMICYTEGLSCAPAIQLECGHVFHYHCCHNALSKRWSGPRITFRFMFCSICENKPISHPHLAEVATPLLELYEEVTRKCSLRLEYENQRKCEAITSPTSKFYQKPQEYAMWKYAYYVCYKCKKAYYGGEAHCAEAVGSDDYDPTELVCPSCSNTGGQLQVCPKHGTDFLEYKCRYCCSVAVYFCFGTTHFCNACHDDFQRVTSIPKSELPQCPVGPRAKPLSGTECPLHVKHPSTGDEFALGCGVCRNAQTF